MTRNSWLRQLFVFRVMALAVLTIAVLTTKCFASSDPCSGTPSCELQQQAPVTYRADQTQGWAYYCTGDHPYYWGAAYAGNSGRWVQTSKWFTTIENGLGETGDPGKLDVTVTNWDAKKQDYTISLACSQEPPPGWNEMCTNTSQWVDHDPACPTVPNTSRKLTRSSGGVPLFFFMWVEQCNANLYWNCSSDQGLVQCSSCAGQSSSAASVDKAEPEKSY